MTEFRPKRQGSGKKSVQAFSTRRRFVDAPATDSAKALAGQHDVDLERVTPSEDREIVEADVAAVVEQVEPAGTEQVEPAVVPPADKLATSAAPKSTKTPPA